MRQKEKGMKKQVNVELDEEQFGMLDSLATKYGITRSAILKIALAQLHENTLIVAEVKHPITS